MTDPLADEIILKQLNDAGVLRLTLNDNARRNALSESMLEQLGKIILSASTDEAIRVIILAANGPAFCAGHDLKEITAARTADDDGLEYFTQLLNKCAAVMQSIVNCPKPVIAEINGIATAAGCQLVASCDLAYAAETAKFGTPGVHIGLFCSTPMVALSRNVSNKHAMEMLLTGDMITAARAADIGLINEVIAVESLSASTMQIASTIAQKSSMAVATGKQAFYAQKDLALEDAYAYASLVMVENMLKDDAKEGIGAFIEKRKAVWTDK